MKNITVIGGGIIGLSSAYYLQQAGHTVTVIDRTDLSDTCSVGNAGMVVPSHIIPLAAPGMISKGVRWMFNRQSPFYINPRFNKSLMRWGYQFYKHATHAHVNRSIPALKEISLLSKALYKELNTQLPFAFGFEEKGLLMLYQSKETEKEEREAAHVANQHGMEARILSGAELQAMEPAIKISARGAVYFPGDAHLIPHVLVKGLVELLKQKGVTFLTETEVKDFRVANNQITGLVTEGQTIEFDEYVLATGAWSETMATRLNLVLPLQGGKGYSFMVPDTGMRIPSILLEGRVAVTPMNGEVRFGGTMEVNGTDMSVNLDRVRGIVNTIPVYYPELNIKMPEVKNIWRGLRPCSPDGLPYIGRSQTIKNLIIATGHSMMGLSLGPATGKLVSEIVDQQKPSMSLEFFNPQRYN